MRTTALLGLLILPVSLFAGSIESGRRSDTQTLSFERGGVIQLERSFGDVDIEGWDRAEVEITTIRTFEPEKDSDTVAITAVKQGEDHLKITTQHTKTKPDLKYVIKAPLQAKLIVHHEMGQVSVVNFTNDIEVTNRIGEVALRLPEPGNYTVNAKTRVGDLSSDVGSSTRQHLIGQQLRGDFFTRHTGMHPQLFLRVGIGDITIRKINW